MVTEPTDRPDTDAASLLEGVSTSEYPFSANFLEVSGGHRMHYVDTGQGHPVVMVHGNPTWSFYYRKLIERLADDYRCLAPDHIGCGLSDKPGDDSYDYTLTSRVEDFGRFVDEVLEADQQLTLVLHDWGGMIGMRWAVDHPERIRRLVITNTAAFHLPEDKSLPAPLRLVRDTGLGKFLVDRFNAFSRGATRFAVANRLPTDVRDGYRAPYRRREDRIATLRFVEDIPLEPTDPAWQPVSETQQQLDLFDETPVLLGWGLKDFVFDEDFLDRWRTVYPHARCVTYPDAGHLVLEDRPEQLGADIEQFLAET